jgi:hypothetical protein
MIPKNDNDWSGDDLDYGYVLDRTPTGEWWHLHFARSDRFYYCKLLTANTNIFACIRKFAPWAVMKSPNYCLTLEGEGVDYSVIESGLTFSWNDAQTQAKAFQATVVPRLHENADFQRACASIVNLECHWRIVE